MEHSRPDTYCPGCDGPLGPAARHGQPHAREEERREESGPAQCPYCGLPLTGEELAEVRRIDAELAGLERHWAALYGRRHELLAGLRARARGCGPDAYGQDGGPGGASGPVPGYGPVPAAPPVGRSVGGAETSSYTARNVLLLLGGVLLTVAAIAFTLLSWGDMGVGGRAAVLGGLTLGTLAVPLPLVRRKLRATAEAVAGFGLALLVLDAYALHEVWLPHVDGVGYAAFSAALIAALAAGYGSALPEPGLRLPVPFGVAAAQLPLPLWALTSDDTQAERYYGLAAALLLTFAGDVALAVAGQAGGRWSRTTALPVRVTAAVAAVPAGVLTMGVTFSQQYAGPGPIARWTVPQALVAAVLLYAGRRAAARRLAGALGVAAGLVLIAALGGAVWAVTPDGGPAARDRWVLVQLLCAAALSGALLVPAVRRPWPARQSAGLAVAAVVVHCGALLWALLPVAQAAFGPWAFVTRAWEGPPRGPLREAVDGYHAWAGSAATTLTLLLAALSVALSAGAARGPGRGPGSDRSSGGESTAERAPGPAVPVRPVLPVLQVLPVRPVLPVLGAAAGVTVPLALGLPYGPALAAVVAVAVVLVGVAAVTADAATGTAALASGLVVSGTASGLALARQGATLTVAAVLCAGFAAAACSARSGPGRRAAAAASAVAYAAALSGSAAAAFELPPHQASFAVLAVAVATVPAAAWLRPRTAAAPGPQAARAAVSLAVECAGYAAASAALLLCAPRPGTLWPALAVCSVAAAGAALRPDRRRGAGYASAALLVMATWVRLAASGVSTPEAYTLPVSAALLTVGWLRRRRTGGDPERPRVSSWWAYGGGLAFTFVPSLVTVGSDPYWLRPLLLGAGALGSTLAGARCRAQAPLLLGGATLAAVGVHELAPYVVQVAWLLPRWLVPALAGLLLVATGATYERRLEEARRLKRAWQRLS